MSTEEDENQEEEEFEVPEFHRDHDLDETGTSQVVIERFVHYRLPQLLTIKEEMDAGKVLTSGELVLMTRMLTRAKTLSHFVYEHEEYSVLVGKIISLIGEITDEALDNETDPDHPGSPR